MSVRSFKTLTGHSSTMDLDFNDVAGPSSRRPHFPPRASSSFSNAPRTPIDRQKQPATDDGFQIFTWFPHYQTCLTYFLDHAQHTQQVQTVAAFVNIYLPYQWRPAVTSTRLPHQFLPAPPMGSGGHQQQLYQSPSPTPYPPPSPDPPLPAVSVIPYLRRLVATGFDTPEVLHGFFGNSWKEGIGSMHEVERRNYLFAAKSGSWLDVKTAYDLSPHETIPFMKPLQRAAEEEIQGADREWSNWLAMQDWMVGPRAPDVMDASASGERTGPRIKKEPRD